MRLNEVTSIAIEQTNAPISPININFLGSTLSPIGPPKKLTNTPVILPVPIAAPMIAAEIPILRGKAIKPIMKEVEPMDEIKTPSKNTNALSCFVSGLSGPPLTFKNLRSLVQVF